jgi:hypothetical protein
MTWDRCALGLHYGDKQQLAQVNQRERNEEIGLPFLFLRQGG